MTTTALFAEILVAGVQALLWIGLLSVVVLRRLGIEETISWTDLEVWIVPITVGLLTLAYTLGIVVDRVADSVMGWIYDRFRTRLKRAGKKQSLVRQEGSGATAEFLEYQRSRLRVARATCLNVALTIVVTLIAVPLDPSAWRLLALLAGILALLFPAVLFAWVRIQEAYDRRLRDAVKLIRAGQ